MAEQRSHLGTACEGLTIIVLASVLGLIIGYVMNYLSPGGP
jgi:hypothetical protein